MEIYVVSVVILPSYLFERWYTQFQKTPVLAVWTWKYERDFFPPILSWEQV